MHRVLSFQMGMGGRGFGESSEFVTKRMCFSFIFFIAFLALLGGFLLGKITTERSAQMRKPLICVNNNSANEVTVNNVINDSELNQRHLNYYNQLVEELRKNFTHNNDFVSTNRIAQTADPKKANETIVSNNLTNLEVELLNLRLFSSTSMTKSRLTATLNGSNERDRWIIISLCGDEINVGVDLARIYAKLYEVDKWKPKRTIIFCFSYDPQDSCIDNYSKQLKSRILAHLTAVRENAIQKNGCLVSSGSDIVNSLVLDTLRESIFRKNFDDDEVLDSCRKNGDDGRYRSSFYLPRLDSDVPHASFSFKTFGNSSTTVKPISEEIEILEHRKTLVRIIGLSVFKLSETAILNWDAKDFVKNVENGLKMINSSQFIDIKERISSTLQNLITSAESLNKRINITQENFKSSSLSSRMINDLLMDLERALLCSDINLRSKTDLASIPTLLTSSQNSISLFLTNLSKCYDDALAVLQEG